MYTNVGPDAAWRKTRISHDTYMLTDGSSPWALVRGWHIDLCYRDICHVVFLGWGKDLAGSLILQFAEHHKELHAELVTMDNALHHLYLRLSSLSFNICCLCFIEVIIIDYLVFVLFIVFAI